jgi:hypothetical protein
LAVASAAPTGDTFDFGWAAWHNINGVWTWGNPADGLSDPPPAGVNFSGAGGIVGKFTFGTPGTFSFLGNPLVVTSSASVDPDGELETWTIAISAQDGGPIYDPVDKVAEAGGVFRGWHLREITIGQFAPYTGGDPLNASNFVGFETPQPVGEWSFENARTEYFAGATPATSNQEIAYARPFGDLDFDADVDSDDYPIWSNNFGATGVTAFAQGDASGDTNVDAADYTVWRDNLGADFAVPALTDAQTSFAKQEPTGVYFNRQFMSPPGTPGLILYDDGVYEVNNPQVTRIVMTIDVRRQTTTAAVPEPSALVTLLIITAMLHNSRGLIVRGVQ